MNSLMIPVDPNSTKPLYMQIVDHVTALARSGQLQSGDSLPPSRALADQLRVHRSTVVNAYEELKARGILEARQGSKSYIAAGLVEVDHTAKTIIKPQFTHPANFVADLWRLHQTQGIISLALGIPADELLPLQEFDRARQRVLRRDGAKALSDEDAQGYYPLRRAIAADLARHGIIAEANDLIITWGAREGISLVARALAATGDEALIEMPTFFGTLFNLNHLGLKLRACAITSQGLDWTSLLHQIETATTRPRFACVVPDHHNPTGICWPMPQRHQFLQLMATHDIPIIEDASYVDLGFDGTPHLPLRALDPEVIYVGSFSKTLMPGLRIGYVLVNGRLRDHLITLKTITSGSGESLGQRTLAEFLTSGHYADYLERIQGAYRARRDATLQALATYFPDDAQWTQPKGGFYVWVTLPETVSVEKVFRRALERGLAIAPAVAFYAHGPLPSAFRIAYSRYSEEVLNHAMRTLAEVIKAEMRVSHRRVFEAIP
jgi:DNA-binding transcriptional MocR family regulator